VTDGENLLLILAAMGYVVLLGALLLWAEKVALRRYGD
jgi:hypothetical protein